MFGVGGGVYISRLLGAKQVVKASQVASVSVITSVMLAALIALVCNAFLPDILLFMGANEEMISLAESYGRLFIISCVRDIECVHVQYHCFTRCVEDICVGNDHRLYR